MLLIGLIGSLKIYESRGHNITTDAALAWATAALARFSWVKNLEQIKCFPLSELIISDTLDLNCISITITRV